MTGAPYWMPASSMNAHCGEALTCSGPPGGGYLRAGRRLLRTQRLDELRDRGADLVGAVLLDEVRPVDRGLGEVGPRPDERAWFPEVRLTARRNPVAVECPDEIQLISRPTEFVLMPC